MIGNNLNAPLGNAQTNELAMPVYMMSSLVLLVMWSLVAGNPCQDRKLQTHFNVPRNFTWAAPVMSIHEKIIEESKKKERKGSSRLLKEVHLIEKAMRMRRLKELLDAAHVLMDAEKENKVRQAVEELKGVCEALKEGLELLERQVRDAFHRIVRSQTEGLDTLGKSHLGE